MAHLDSGTLQRAEDSRFSVRLRDLKPQDGSAPYEVIVDDKETNTVVERQYFYSLDKAETSYIVHLEVYHKA